MSGPMLIFDFDGVLLDSVREVALTAFNMVRGCIATRLSQLPPNVLDLFLRNRFHVQPIGDAPVLMIWCLETAKSDPGKLLTAEEYYGLIQQAAQPVAARTARFFKTRDVLKNKDLQAWTALNTPVQPLWDVLAQAPNENLVLLTNKNLDATIALCNHFGLEIRDGNVYSGDKGVTKIENMTRIMQRFGEPTYAFIDDSVKNLREIDTHFNRRHKTIALIFAAWGYSGPHDARRAAGYGYQVATLDEFSQSLRTMKL